MSNNERGLFLVDIGLYVTDFEIDRNYYSKDNDDIHVVWYTIDNDRKCYKGKIRNFLKEIKEKDAEIKFLEKRIEDLLQPENEPCNYNNDIEAIHIIYNDFYKLFNYYNNGKNKPRSITLGNDITIQIGCYSNGKYLFWYAIERKLLHDAKYLSQYVDILPKFFLKEIKGSDDKFIKSHIKKYFVK
jgi:hypothetical protein